MNDQDQQETAIALINNNIGYIQKDILEIKVGLKDSYATKEGLIQVAKDTEVRLQRLENASNLWRWLSPSLGAIMGSTMTFLIINYLMRLK